MKTPPTGHDGQLPPVMTVIAGLPGAGKTTILDQLLGEADFPQHLVVDDPAAPEALDDALTGALAANQSVAVETCCDDAAVIEWMRKAAERRYDVELVIVGTEDDPLLQERHARRRTRRELLEAARRMSSAVDAARRVMVIDNSSGQPFVAARIEAGEVKVFDNRPAWVARRILLPRLERAASMKAMRATYQGVTGHQMTHPMLQVARGGAAYTGKILAMTDHHVLQQIGQALHVIHDLGLLGTGGVGLALNVVATLAHDMGDRRAAAQSHEQHRDHSAER